MSTRPVATSIRGVNVAVTLPWRRNVPSCTLRTRSTLGLNVTVNVTVEMRDALATVSGTVYGPPATRNSCGAVTLTWATDGGGTPWAAATGGAVGSRGAAAGGAPAIAGAGGGSAPTGGSAVAGAPACPVAGGVCGTAPGGVAAAGAVAPGGIGVGDGGGKN